MSQFGARLLQPCSKLGFLQSGLGKRSQLRLLRDKGASHVSVTEPALPQDWLPTDWAGQTVSTWSKSVQC